MNKCSGEEKDPHVITVHILTLLLVRKKLQSILKVQERGGKKVDSAFDYYIRKGLTACKGVPEKVV